MLNHRRVTAIIPALNEARSIGLVVEELKALRTTGASLVDQIIVCDNGSDDGTGRLAMRAGANVVTEPQHGYGAACLAALKAFWQTDPHDEDIVVFVDADHSVKASELPCLLVPLQTGSELVIGNRNAGQQARGALTPQQRFGNWLATALIRFFWREPVHDLGPFRAIRAGALRRLSMSDRAFGWTVQMQIRAIQEQLTVTEVPVSSLRRIGHSKISGTIVGSLLAGKGILGMVFGMWWEERKQRLRLWWAEV